MGEHPEVFRGEKFLAREENLSEVRALRRRMFPRLRMVDPLDQTVTESVTAGE